jgi:hypothetical protein
MTQSEEDSDPRGVVIGARTTPNGVVMSGEKHLFAGSGGKINDDISDAGTAALLHHRFNPQSVKDHQYLLTPLPVSPVLQGRHVVHQG